MIFGAVARFINFLWPGTLGTLGARTRGCGVNSESGASSSVGASANAMARGTSDLTDETIKEYREAFALFDTDGDGQITASELASFMRRMELTPSEDDVSRMIGEVDADGNGMIDFAEFVTLMARKMNNADKENEIREAFNVYDKDGSGKISKDDLLATMRALGAQLSDQAAEQMIEEADSNGDGEIAFDEFKKLLL